jgi:tetratricopeptide (TPR) repeat protein
VKTEYEWDWTQAEQMYRQAIRKKNAAEFHLAYAVHLAEVGRTREAVAEAQRAHEADPRHPGMLLMVGHFSYIDHQYEQAERVCLEVAQAIPQFFAAHNCLAGVYLQTGRLRQAVTEARIAVDVSNRGMLELMFLGHALGVSGSTEAYTVLDEMMNQSTQRYVPPEYIAVVYAGLGDKDKAFQWLDTAIGQRSMHSWVYPEPRLDSLRSDARFKEIARRMGLPK